MQEWSYLFTEKPRQILPALATRGLLRDYKVVT